MTFNQISEDAKRRWGDNSREEAFSAAGPVKTSIQLVSGDAVVRNGDGNEIRVRVHASGARAQQMLDDTSVIFDAASSTLKIRTPLKSDGGKAFRGLRLGSVSDVDVEVFVPANSSIDARSASGDGAFSGVFDVVDFSSASGDLVVGDVQELHAQSASGDVFAASVARTTNVKSASGDVAVSSVRGEFKVANVSGDVNARLDGAGSVNVHSVSGDVVLDVRQGLIITIDAKTMSGDLTSDIDLSDEGGGESDSDEKVSVSVGTMSGDVRVRRAS